MMRWRWRIALGAAALAAPPTALAASCVRHADLYDEPDAGITATGPTFDAGPVIPVDAALHSDAHPPCAERMEGPCTGPVDFPCDFENFILYAAEQCQKQTGCITNGQLQVTLAADGCVSEIAMETPHQAMIDCLVERVDTVHCPCGASVTNYSFGHGNDGCEGE